MDENTNKKFHFSSAVSSETAFNLLDLFLEKVIYYKKQEI